MARKFKKKKPVVIEDIIKDSLNRIGLNDLSKDKVALLTRLIFSGIAAYFFNLPDDMIDMGYIRFKKNPDKDELFSVNIIRNGKEGIVNADTLWRYYKGELATEAKLKGIIDNFVNNLLEYSQQEEKKIDDLTNRLN